MRHSEETNSVRNEIVAAAVSQIGCGAKDEYYWSALGPKTKDRPPHWCGIFCLYIYHDAGLLLDIEWPIGSSFLAQHLQVTRYPEPGDCAYFQRFQHHAIVEDVGAGFVSTIDGNSTGGKVQRIRRARNYTGVTYYSIARFLK
jgi:hypothetical protein